MKSMFQNFPRFDLALNKVKPKVIIWTSLELLQYQMLHIKFQGNQSIGSREEEF